MEYRILFHESAFKHGCTEADIRWAFKTFVFEKPVEGKDGQYLIAGYDCAAKPCGTLRVFRRKLWQLC